MYFTVLQDQFVESPGLFGARESKSRPADQTWTTGSVYLGLERKHNHVLNWNIGEGPLKRQRARLIRCRREKLG